MRDGEKKERRNKGTAKKKRVNLNRKPKIKKKNLRRDFPEFIF